VNAGAEPTDGSYQVAGRSPLVLLAIAAGSRQLERLAQELAADFPDERFIGVVAARRGEDVPALLATLGPVLAELIFTASSSPGSIPGEVLATEALEEIGIGQDFVFTVPGLPGAIQYAMDVLAHHRRHGWEGTALLVAGSETTVREASQAIESFRKDESS
jgi:folylpolyglutamate synthase/dihydropteroate synthase